MIVQYKYSSHFDIVSRSFSISLPIINIRFNKLCTSSLCYDNLSQRRNGAGKQANGGTTLEDRQRDRHTEKATEREVEGEGERDTHTHK